LEELREKEPTWSSFVFFFIQLIDVEGGNFFFATTFVLLLREKEKEKEEEEGSCCLLFPRYLFFSKYF